MHADQKKWDQRYRQANGPVIPCWVAETYQAFIPSQGKGLDIACGLGGNARLMAKRGLTVHAWDISPVAIRMLNEYAKAQRQAIFTEVRDVVASPPPAESYDVITVSYFLDRSLIPVLIEALRPGGFFFYQTFTKRRFTRDGPSNPGYRLQANELFKHMADLHVIAYHENHLPDIDCPMDEACVVARKL